MASQKGPACGAAEASGAQPGLEPSGRGVAPTLLPGLSRKMVAQGLWIRQTVGRSRKDSPTKAVAYLLSAMDGSPMCAFCKLRHFGEKKEKEKTH